jgi:hypothetical protein
MPAPGRLPGLYIGLETAQCLAMKDLTDLAPFPSDHPAPFIDQLRLAVAAYLARFKGSSREHTESDLQALDRRRIESIWGAGGASDEAVATGGFQSSRGGGPGTSVVRRAC